MTPSNIPLAISLLQRAHAKFVERRAVYICFTLYGVAGHDEYSAAKELVAYIENTLRKELGGDTHILEEIVPRLPVDVPGVADLRHLVYVSQQAKLVDLIRMAWIDKMVDDLQTVGCLP